MKKPSKDSVVKIPNKATSQYMPTESQLRALRFVKISGDKNCYNYELRKFGFYYW